MRTRAVLGLLLVGVAAGAAVEEAALFLTATGGVAAAGSVVDRSSQDSRTGLPVRTSQ
jgi:hypothetical protein